MLRHLVQCRLRDGQALRARSLADDEFDFFGVVGVGGDDEETGQEVRGHAVRGDDVFGAADGAAAPVGGEDDDGGDGGFEGSVQIGEAFDVEHMYLSSLSYGDVGKYFALPFSPRQ